MPSWPWVLAAVSAVLSPSEAHLEQSCEAASRALSWGDDAGFLGIASEWGRGANLYDRPGGQ